MPVDPQIQALLDRGTGVPATHTLPVAEARRLYEARIAVMAPGAEVAKVARAAHRRAGRTHRAAHLHAGRDRPVSAHGVLPRQRLRAVQPRHARRHVPQPGGRHRLRGRVGRLSPRARAQVPRRTGRLPPGDALGGGACGRTLADPTRIMLAGDSAGGNMAAVTALRVRDEGGPALSGQMLLYPVTDYHTPGTPSYVENAEGYGLTRDTMEWFWGHYLERPRRCGSSACLAAARAGPCRPAAGLRHERRVRSACATKRERYGERLRAAGVPTEITRRPGHQSRLPVLGRPGRRRRRGDGRRLCLGPSDLRELIAGSIGRASA